MVSGLRRRGHAAPGGGLKVVTATDCGVTRLAAGTCTVRAVEPLTKESQLLPVPLRAPVFPLDPPGITPFTVSNSELDPTLPSSVKWK